MCAISDSEKQEPIESETIASGRSIMSQLVVTSPHHGRIISVAFALQTLEMSFSSFIHWDVVVRRVEQQLVCRYEECVRGKVGTETDTASAAAGDDMVDVCGLLRWAIIIVVIIILIPPDLHLITYII